MATMTEPVNSPVILSVQMVNKALGDQMFYERVPEFTPMKGKLVAMRMDLNRPGGCGGCKRKRIERNLFGDFLTIAQHLGDDGRIRLRSYYGVPGLMVNVHDQATGRLQLKVI